jgi:[ribosomal protein S5]-alanine N-acetyltransferase
MSCDLLFKEFPHLKSERLVLKRIEEQDIDSLFEIYSNENIFRLRPGNIKKNKAAVLNMIGHFSRDFNKKKTIFLGVYLKGKSGKLIGIGEIFDLNRKVNSITIGYTLNESFWGNGYASEAAKVIIDYLFRQIGINRIQAFVMPRNIKSKNVLKRNKLKKEGTIRQGEFWPGKGVVDLEVYSILKNEYAY